MSETVGIITLGGLALPAISLPCLCKISRLHRAGFLGLLDQCKRTTLGDAFYNGGDPQTLTFCEYYI